MASVHQKQPEPNVIVSVLVILIFLAIFCLDGCAQADKYKKERKKRDALLNRFIVVDL